LNALTPNERRQLKLWLEKGIRAGILDYASGTAESLVERGVLERTDTMDGMGGRMHRIPPFVWDYLNKHPGILSSDEPKTR